jgi:hypothetical protein
MKIVTIAMVLASFSVFGCRTKPKQVHYRATIETTSQWQLGMAKRCLFKDDTKDGMDMKCASLGDPDIEDRYEYLVTADFDKPVHNPGGVYGVVCRLDSNEHVTCIGG